MTIRYILIDFENVQPSAAELRLIRGPDRHVRLFHGPHQTKLDVDLVMALQPLGTQVEYIQCDRKGKNALDFRIAFVLGRIVQERENASSPLPRQATFAVVSKDGGFDELLDHLRTLGYSATRVSTIALALDPTPSAAPAAMPATKSASTPNAAKASPKQAITTTRGKAASDPHARAIANLREHPRNRPRTKAALHRHLKTLLGKGATDAKANALLARLDQDGITKTVDGKIEYRLHVKTAKAAA